MCRYPQSVCGLQSRLLIDLLSLLRSLIETCLYSSMTRIPTSTPLHPSLHPFVQGSQASIYYLFSHPLYLAIH